MSITRTVITGGPGSGKTTLIQHLEISGFSCMHEISREVILEAQKQGVDQLFLEDPLLFSQKLLDGRLRQFKEAAEMKGNLFYDRGLPDVIAYMDYLDTPYPDHFDHVCDTYKYDCIFLLPPWESIYEQDNERYESFEEAEAIYTYLLHGYQKYNYDVRVVPTGNVAERTEFILNNINAAD